MKKQFLIPALLFLLGCAAQQKPNILIIHVDDLGYHDLSATGSVLYNTPEIDALAKASVSFTNAYSSYPRCTPSRYGMITGTYPVQEDKGDLGNLDPSLNFIKQFSNAGYRSSYVGKWHLGDGTAHPSAFGFDHTYAAGRSGGLGSRFYPFNTQKNGKPAKEPVEDMEADGKPGDYASDLLTDTTMSFIKNNPKDQPFLAVLAFYAVHTPIEAKEKDIKRNREQLRSIDFGDIPEYIEEGSGRRKMRQDDPAYAAMVENVDENVGRLMSLLNELGISKNTIVVLSSDHGGLSNDGYQWKRHLATTNNPLKAGKGWLYEGGIRVPLFIRWPGQLKPHTDNKSIVLGMDVLPTLLDLALDKTIEGIDGKSYKKVLFEKEQWDDRTVFWHSAKARPHSTGDPKTSAVRSGNFKLLHFYEEGRTELYDLSTDIGETSDVSAEMPEKAASLMALLNTWKAEHSLNTGKMRKDRSEKSGKRNNEKTEGSTRLK